MSVLPLEKNIALFTQHMNETRGESLCGSTDPID